MQYRRITLHNRKIRRQISVCEKKSGTRLNVSDFGFRTNYNAELKKIITFALYKLVKNKIIITI
jgi:hypothetical protein